MAEAEAGTEAEIIAEAEAGTEAGTEGLRLLVGIVIVGGIGGGLLIGAPNGGKRKTKGRVPM